MPANRWTYAVASSLHPPHHSVRIRLTKKLAGSLNGIDLRAVHVGDVFDLADGPGRLLVAERWAEEIAPGIHTRSTAHDRPARDRGPQKTSKQPRPK